MKYRFSSTTTRYQDKNQTQAECKSPNSLLEFEFGNGTFNARPEEQRTCEVFLFKVLVFRPSRVNHLQFLLITLSQARTPLRLKFQKIDFYFPICKVSATKIKQSDPRHANFPKPRHVTTR